MKKPLRIIIAASVSAAGLWWALRGTAPAQWAEAWRSAVSPGWLLLIPAAMGIEFLLRSVRWGILLPRSSSLPLRRLFSITAGGFFLNTILPFRAGEAARLLWTYRDTKLPAASCAAVLGLDRLFDMLALATMTLWVLARWRGFPGAGRSAVFFGVGVAGAALVLWTVARRPGLASALAKKIRLPERPRRWVEEFARGAAPVADLRVFLGLYVLSLCFWSMNVVLFTLVSRVFRLGLSLTEGTALISAFAVGAALPSTPGYVGTLDAAGVALLLAAGRSRAAAVPFVLTVHVVQMLSTPLYGIPSLIANSGRRPHE